VFDEQGRFAPTFRPWTEDVIPADTVILAVGQAADLDLLADGPEIERSRGGGIAIDPETLRTSHPKVWAGGDVARGPRNLIDAIADGRTAAASILRTLRGEAPVAPEVPSVRVSLRTGYRRIDTGYDAIARRPVPLVATDRRVGFAEVEVGYDETDAQVEALRCLRCFDNVMLSPELCILCGLCVDICPTDCIVIARADDAGVGVASQSALFLDEDRCIRCGLCVNRCPPGALSMVHAQEVTHA
jgi:NADPH-dependent glutamate synthase beta subunit-like oxidoreductase